MKHIKIYKSKSKYVLFLILFFSVLTQQNIINTNTYNQNNVTYEGLNSTQPEETRFRIGTTTSASSNWDIAVAPVGTTITTMFLPSCTETLLETPETWDGDFNNFIPVLATTWTIEFWPEETNSAGFINRGGVANVTFRLREGVTFHDGSNWNASVAKWNIDRVFIITGNLTGNGDMRNRENYWIKANDWIDYYTEDWNLSSYIGISGYYDQWSNPHPDGQLYQYYPVVKRVVVTDNVPSGGEIRIEFNDFNTYGMTGVGLVRYI